MTATKYKVRVVTGPSADQVIRSAALSFGRTLTDEEVHFVAWERTAYPLADIWTIADQAHQCFAYAEHGFQPCARCGRAAEQDICEPCERDFEMEDAP